MEGDGTKAKKKTDSAKFYGKQWESGRIGEETGHGEENGFGIRPNLRRGPPHDLHRKIFAKKPLLMGRVVVAFR